jgi:hypothetical protein
VASVVVACACAVSSGRSRRVALAIGSDTGAWWAVHDHDAPVALPPRSRERGVLDDDGEISAAPPRSGPVQAHRLYRRMQGLAHKGGNAWRSIV